MVIYLGPQLLTASSNLPEGRATRAESRYNTMCCSSPLFDLASGGVYKAIQVTLDAGELLPHRFTLTSCDEHGWRFTFCCTFPDLTAGRR